MKGSATMTDINKEYEKEYYDEYRNNYYNPDDDDGEPGINLNWKRIQKGFHSVAGNDTETAETLSGMQADYTELSDDVSELKNALSAMDTATNSDIGKALSPKTVTNGHVSEWQFKSISGGGGGTSDYSDLDNKPQINNVTLVGNKSLADLGIASADSFDDLLIQENLLNSEIPGTTQTVVFDSNGNPTSITHTANNTTVRTDIFVWGTGTVTETRTLATGKYITITVNLDTLAQTISVIQEVA